MLAKIQTHSKAALRRVPFVQSFLKERNQRIRYSTELELINGIHHNQNAHPSILHFSLNKAATQYTKNILRRCASSIGMVPVHLHEYAFNSEFPYLDHFTSNQMENYRHIFKPKGYLYSVFGGMIEGIPQLDEYKLIFMTRDPRDVLVSEYYSIAYSHVIPAQKGSKYDEFMGRRNAARSMTIDEFVLADSVRLYGILNRYKTLLVDRYPHAYVTTYEKMTADFQGWLNELLDRCQLVIAEELRESLLEESCRLRPKAENIYKHIRKGKPEDYREKLRPETIHHLNEKFSTLLETFRYS